MWISRVDLQKKKGKNCREVSGIIKEGGVFYPSRPLDFPNHFSILLQNCQQFFFRCFKHQVILLLCLMEFYDDGFSMMFKET